MARIRTIKPDFFISDTVSALPLRARLTWIGLWTHCDDYGRCRDNVKLIKAAVWPLDDVSLRDIESDLADLERCGVLFRYSAMDGKSYLQITNWAEHQKVDRPSKSSIPAPREGTVTPPAPPPSNGHGNYADRPSMDTRETLASPREDASRARDGKGKEGKGREGTRDARTREAQPATPGPEPPTSEPPLRCQEHIHDPMPPPCGSCADARRAHVQWEADRARRQAQAPRCSRHPGQTAARCGPCRSEQIARPPDDPVPEAVLSRVTRELA